MCKSCSVVHVFMLLLCFARPHGAVMSPKTEKSDLFNGRIWEKMKNPIWQQTAIAVAEPDVLPSCFLSLHAQGADWPTEAVSPV